MREFYFYSIKATSKTPKKIQSRPQLQGLYSIKSYYGWELGVALVSYQCSIGTYIFLAIFCLQKNITGKNNTPYRSDPTKQRH